MRRDNAVRRTGHAMAALAAITNQRVFGRANSVVRLRACMLCKAVNRSV